MPRTLLLAILLWSGAATAANRVVTLAPNLAELVCAAGGCGRLVGVSSYTDFPSQITKLPDVGDAYALNLEAVIALKPDLVLAWGGGTSPQTLARLRDLGLHVEPVSVQGLAGVADALLQVGRLLGTQATASAAADAYLKHLDALRERYRDAPKLRVMYQIEADPAFSISGKSPISSAIALCGGINVFAGLRQIAAPVSKEAVLAANPDVVVYGRDDARGVRDYWRGFPQATAVRNGDLYALDTEALERPAPRMLDGVERLCAALDQARGKRRVSK